MSLYNNDNLFVSGIETKFNDIGIKYFNGKTNVISNRGTKSQNHGK